MLNRVHEGKQTRPVMRILILATALLLMLGLATPALAADSAVYLDFYAEDGHTPEAGSMGGKYVVVACTNYGNSIDYLAKADGASGTSYQLIFADDSGNTFNSLPDNNYTFKIVAVDSDLDLNYIRNRWNYDPDGHIGTKYENSGASIGPYTLTFPSGKDADGNYHIKFTKKSGYNVTVNFVDSAERNPVTPGSDGAPAITDKAYIKAELLSDGADGSTTVVGYAIVPISTSGSSNSVVLDSFKTQSGNMSYAQAMSSGYRVGGIRLFHTTDSNENPGNYNSLNDYNNALSQGKITEGDFDGYTFVKNLSPDDKTRIIVIRQTDPTKYQVKVDVGDKPLEIPADANVYAKVTVSFSSGAKGYSYIKLDDSQKDEEGNYLLNFSENQWYLERNGSLAPSEALSVSGHEQNMKVELYAAPKGATITSPNQLNDVIPLGSFVQDHKVVSYPNVNRDDDDNPNRTIVDVKDPNDGDKILYKQYTDIIRLAPDDSEFDGYSLEYILNDYNIVALCPNTTATPSHSDPPSTEDFAAGNTYDGDFLMENHCMGGVLVRGDVIHKSGTGVGDSELITKPSVVGGYVPESSGPFFNNRHNNDNGWNGYVGSMNTVAGDFYVNGVKSTENVSGQLRGYTGTNGGHTIARDDFVDWDRLQATVINTSKELARSAAEKGDIVNYTSTTINVTAGSNIILNYPENTIVTINIIAQDASGNPITDPNKIPGTVISNLGSGTYTCPKLTLNGASLDTTEDGSGMSVVYNFPFAERVNVTTDITPEFGHVVAPAAFVDIQGGNYSGCMVGNKVRSVGEGHLYSYHGGDLLGFYGDLEMQKLVNDEAPTDKQKFKFNLEKLSTVLLKQEYHNDPKEFWTWLMKVENEGSKITFKDVPFTHEGKNYFMIYEDQDDPTPKANETRDTTKYLVEVMVVSRVTGDDKTILEMQPKNPETGESQLKYYEILDEEHLTNVNEIQEVLYDPITHQPTGELGAVFAYGSAINPAAVEEVGNLSWDPDAEKLTTDMTFINGVEEVKVQATLSGQKTLEGRTLAADQFSYTIKGTNDKTETVTTTTVKNRQAGDFSTTFTYKLTDFDEVEFEEEAPHTITYTYTITEDIPADAVAQDDDSITYSDDIRADHTWVKDGIAYDGASYTVTVAVTDNQDGTMSTQVTGPNTALNFTNKYSAETDITLEALKNLNGKTLTAGQFSFSLTGSDISQTGKTNAADGKVTFDTLKFALNPTQAQIADGYIDVTEWFTEEGEIVSGEKNLTLTIAEENLDSLPEHVAAVEPTSREATVKVSYDVDTGVLTAALDPATQTFEFTNNWNAETQVDVSVAKTLTGRTLKEKEFTFQLSGTGIAEAQTVQNGADGKASFSTVKFAVNPTDEQTDTGYIDATAWFTDENGKLKTGTKELTWTVEELDPLPEDVTVVGDQSKTLTVTLAYDAAAGTLTATPNPSNTEFAFENAFHATTEASVSAKKVLTGRTLGNGEFTFTLSGTGIETQIKTNNAAGAVAFEPLRFAVNPTEQETAEGYIDITDIIKTTNPYVLNLTVKESTDGLADKHITLVTPEGGVVAVTVTVTQAEDGSLSAAVSPDEAAAFVFTNAYHTDTDIELSATKVLEGLRLAEGQFTFSLKGEGIQTQEKKNDENGAVAFDKIHFAVNPTKEQTDAGYIDVTGWFTDEDGKIKNGNKTIELTIAEENLDSLPEHVAAVEPTSQVATVKVSYNAATGELTAALDPATQTFEFTNEKNAVAQVEVSVAKTLTGRTMKENEFTFKLGGDEITEQTVQNGADGKASFSTVKFAVNPTDEQTADNGYIDATAWFTTDGKLQSGTKMLCWYVEEEDLPANVKVVGDQIKDLTVTLEYNADEGTLTANPIPSNTEFTFKNAFHATTEASVSAKKVLTGRTLGNEEFTFTLSGSGIETQTKKNNAAGAVAFEPLKFAVNPTAQETAEGYIDITNIIKTTNPYELNLTVKESTDGLADKHITLVTPESGEVAVKVTVTQAENGSLSASVTPTDTAAFTFTNAFHAETEVQLKAKKALEGMTLSAGQFTFTLTGNGIEQSKQNDENGAVAFDKIHFAVNPTEEQTRAGYIDVTDLIKESGEYVFTFVMAEDTTNLPKHVTAKAPTSYEVKIKVTQDASTGELHAAITEPADAKFEFTNEYSTETQVTVQAKKTLNGRNLNEGEFTFTLRGDGVSQEKTNGADGKVNFDAIKFAYNATQTQLNAGYIDVKGKLDANNQYKLTLALAEVTTGLAAKDITPVGDTSQTVTILVTYDEEEGTLNAAIDPEDAVFEFTNEFNAETSLDLEATKTLNGKNLKKDDFTFTLTGTGVNQEKKNAADGKVTFDTIKFVVNPTDKQTAANGYINVTDLLDETGKYELSLTMAEDTENLPDDVTPDPDGPTSYNFKVIVTQNQETGKLSATIDPQSAEFKFTNEYNAVASVSLEALKKLSGKTLKADDFTFTLKDADGRVDQEKKNGNDGIRNEVVAFDPIHFVVNPKEGQTVANGYIDVTDLLDEAGQYTLTLTMAEDTDSLPPNIIPVGQTEKTVTIQVSYNRDTGVITAATVPADAEFTFLNANNAEAEVQVKGKKTLNGRTLEAGEFTFKLSGDQIKTETKTNAADGGEVEFSPVKFVVNPTEDQTADAGYINVTSLFMKNGVLSTGEATLNWKVTEDTEASNWPENVTPVDDTEKAVKVTLNYDAEAGTLTAKTDLDEAGFEFVNAYNAAAGVTVTATKKLDGRDLKAKDFTFTLTGDGVDQEKQNDANGKVTFDTINFAVNPTEDQTAENGYIDVTDLLVKGKYTLTLTLAEDLDKLPDDVKPEGDTSQTVTIQVTYDEEEGTLNAAIDPEDAVFEFTNKYNAAAEVTVKAKKQLTGKTLKAGDFTFTLKGTDPLADLSDSKTNGQDGLVTFDTLKFALNPTDEQADYIDVTDWFKNADGKIVSGSKQIKLTVAEVTEGLDEKGITPVGDTSKEIKLTVAYNASTGELTASIDPTSPVFTFRNKYTTDTGIIVTAQKTLNGREMVDGEFTFTLKGNGVNQQKNAGDGGAVEFDAIQFVLNPTEEMDAIDVTNLLEDGEYTLELTLAEVTTGLADKGITPVGDTSKTVKIKVTYDEDEGTLSAALDPANATFEFTNDYKAEGDVTFAGAKTIDNRDLMEGDVFRFTIQGDDEFEKTVACDIATGKIQYPTITYVLDKDHLDVLGDHTYTITEETVDMDGVTKDETTHEVTVTVSDKGDGTLKVTPSGSITGLNFVNHYETETEIELGAQKRLKNGTLSADQFTFTLTGKTDDTPMPENAEAGNAADGSVAFGPITYTLDDLDRDQGGFKTTVYEYTITETVPDGVNARNILDGVRYDGNSFNVKVTLTYDRTKGELKANADKEANDLVFINEQLGKLQLEKTWEGEDIGEDIQNLLKFTVEGKNVNPDGEEKDKLEITYADFTDGQYLIEDLPIGETYKVTEENAVNLSEDWHLVRKDSVTAGEATTKDGTVTVSLTNKYDTYTALKITKAVESTVQVKNRFDFEVELTEDGSVLTGEYPTVLTDASGKEKEGTLSFGDDGKAAFKLGDGETLTIQHLPQGVHYAVNEKEIKGFLLTEMVDADGVLEKEPSEAKFVNTAETTKFQVTKQWVGGNAGIISLTLYRQEKGRMVPLSPQPGVTRDGDVYTFENLPKYDENGNLIVYAAKEKGVDGFMIHYANIGEHSGDSSYVYDGGTIINSLVTDIAVLKVWEGLADKQAKPEIKLVLYKDGKPTNKKPRLDKNGWYHFYNLEVDHEYYVVEEKSSAYTTEYKNKGSFAEYTDRAYNYGTIINHTIPKTGDETPLALWIGLAGVSAVGLAALVILRKKRSKSK